MQTTDQAYEYPSMFGHDRRTMNGTLTPARNLSMLQVLGLPHGRMDAECRAVENPALAALMTTMRLGAGSATGLNLALAALNRALTQLAAAQPGIMDRIGIEEALCCRMVTGSDCVIANHAWGAAITLRIDGGQDPAWNPSVRQCLLALAPVLVRHGFFWGAAHVHEAPLEFELSEQLLQSWVRAGHFGPVAPLRPSGLGLGDRGLEVEEVQHRLNRALAPCLLEVDGRFGPATRAAVVEFQRRSGLRADGVVSRLFGRTLERRTQDKPRRRGADRGWRNGAYQVSVISPGE